MTFRFSLLEKQNGNNEVSPLFPSYGPHVLFSSQHPRHFGRYSIVLNRGSLWVLVSIRREKLGSTARWEFLEVTMTSRKAPPPKARSFKVLFE
jgi:hypothetical protein